MTEEELRILESRTNAAIIAPAGHGKTEMVVDMIAIFAEKQLVLTHTNAGVDAIHKRMSKRNINSKKCAVMTIASFCMRWVYAYHWTANVDIILSPLDKSVQEKYYSQLYSGALELFKHRWAGAILKASYSGIIVDEYQDCTLIQHSIICQLNKYLPVKVLGDPLQGIFGFRDPIVNWEKIGFDVYKVKTYPWRWEKSNPVLGTYLSELRDQLLPTLDNCDCKITIKSIPGVIQLVSKASFNGYSLLPQLQKYSSILYLTKWEREQLDLCKRMSGIFQLDEKQDCNILFEFAEQFDSKTNVELLLSIFDFVANCATQVKKEYGSFIKNLQKGSMDFSRIRKNPELGEMLLSLGICKSAKMIEKLLQWFLHIETLKFYRRELYYEMLRTIRLSDNRGVSFYDAAKLIRNDVSLQKRYTNFKYLSSRTLLSKGLEFDCVIIDACSNLSAKEFYVAMTRAKQMIFVITSQSTLILKP